MLTECASSYLSSVRFATFYCATHAYCSLDVSILQGNKAQVHKQVTAEGSRYVELSICSVASYHARDKAKVTNNRIMQ